jgi:hypothetical protein
MISSFNHYIFIGLASPYREEFKIMLDELDWMDHKVSLDEKIILATYRSFIRNMSQINYKLYL